MTAGVTDTSANLPPMWLRSREIFDWRYRLQRRKIRSWLWIFSHIFREEKNELVTTELLGHGIRWFMEETEVKVSDTVASYLKFSRKWNCRYNCHKNKPVWYYPVVVSWRKEDQCKIVFAGLLLESAGNSSSMGIYDVRPTRMRSNIPLLEPGSPRFFWWYENSE